MISIIPTLFFVFFYNLVAIDGTPGPSSGCLDCVYIESTQSLYKFHEEKVSWDDAVAACSSEGAQLFYPEDEGEVKVVLTAAFSLFNDSYSIWIGISDPDKNESYKTVDGRPISEVYHNWSLGEPNQGSDGICHWVTIQKDFTLYVGCPTWRNKFICNYTLKTKINRPRPGMATQSSVTKDYISIEATNSLYKFHDEKVSWIDAFKTCSSEGAYLFYPEDEAELQAVSRAIPMFSDSDYMWVGTAFAFHEEPLWTIGLRVVSEMYYEWSAGEPNRGPDRVCRWVTLKKDYKLFVGCSFWRETFICKLTPKQQILK